MIAALCSWFSFQCLLDLPPQFSQQPTISQTINRLCVAGKTSQVVQMRPSMSTPMEQTTELLDTCQSLKSSHAYFSVPPPGHLEACQIMTLCQAALLKAGMGQAQATDTHGSQCSMSRPGHIHNQALLL